MTEVSTTATDESDSPRDLNNKNSASQLNSPRPSSAGWGGKPSGSANADAKERRASTQPATPSLPAKSRTAPVSGETADPSENAAIDPLSHHILKRTHTEKSIPYKLRQDSGADGNKPSPADINSHRNETFPLSTKAANQKRKGVSFLSRIIGTKKLQFADDENDSHASASQAGRQSGEDDIFAHPVGFIPRVPPPPKYIKVKAHFKKQKAFDRVFLAQELDNVDDDHAAGGHEQETRKLNNNKSVWAMIFSKDGRYLAAAGQDKVVRVWAVITNTEDREAHEQEENEIQGVEGLRLTAPVFKTKPIREYHGHTGSVLDLSWSKNNFLLSSSMDRTVRLWHVTRAECLCCFKHSDFVTSIQFHPRDDRFFLAGSLDSTLRLWSIPDKSVAFLATVRDMITSVAFTPDGKYAIAGCLNGLCILYETDGLKANSQVHVRSARGRNAKGSKITGIDTITNANGDVKLLITSNDSRIRLYNFKDRSLEAKYRGNENSTSQIRASFSDDGRYIICGSEDRSTYIWPTGADREGKRALEELETRTDMVTCAIMAPTSTKQLLGFSGDPLYDLCNPPPVTLVSSSAHPSKASGSEPPQKDGDSTATTAIKASPGYLARSRHPDGNILLVADYSGRIKVFRQDCAYNKRPSSSKLLGRSNSARHSIASSIGRESRTPSERILAWRSSVAGTELASINSSPGSRNRTPSPRKSVFRRSRYSSPVNSGAPKTESEYATPASRSVVDVESGSEEQQQQQQQQQQAQIEITNAEDETDTESILESEEPEEEEAEAIPDIPRFIEGGQSNAFWTKGAEFVENIRSGRLLHPHDAGRRSVDFDDGGSSSDIRRRSSAVSALSSDLASSQTSGDDDDEHADADEMAASATERNGQALDEGEILRCVRCRGTNFRATKRRGAQKLVCVRCSAVMR